MNGVVIHSVRTGCYPGRVVAMCFRILYFEAFTNVARARQYRGIGNAQAE